jgi:hypothetical protein
MVPTGVRRLIALRIAEAASEGLHPRVDGVAHDLVGVAVLDRTQVQLPLGGGVLGDIGQPLDVRGRGGEVAGRAAVPVGDLQQVVVHWRSRLAVEATLLGVQREDPLERAQPPHPVLRSGDAMLGELISDDPVPVAGIVDVDVEGGVDQVGIVPIPLTDIPS